MLGKLVCYMHGGKSLAGIESPTFRTGRYSKFLPERLLATYQAALDDEDLTALDDEIALLDSRIGDVLERLNTTGEGPVAWQAATGGYRDLRASVIEGDSEAALVAIRTLDGVFARGAREYASWREVIGLVEQRRKIVETERKRLMDEDRAVSIEKLMLMMAAIIDVIRRHVASRETRSAIADEIRRLVSGTDGSG